MQGNQVTESKRQFYRLTYPHSGRPELLVAGKTFPVVDISECGMRLQVQQNDIQTLPVGETVCGQVRFTDGESFEIAGAIIRHADVSGELQCAVFLSKGIPYSRMVAEQRFMLQIFPAAKRFK